MSSAPPGGVHRPTDLSEPRSQSRAHTGRYRAAVRASVALAGAVALTLLLAPGAARADPPHEHGARGPVAAGRRASRGEHFNGRHWHAGRPDRHWAGAGRGGAWREYGRRDWRGERWGGNHSRWRGAEHWHAGDRGDWDHHHWRGAVWLGGDWGGLYWPPVNYGWNYPWFMASVPLGAMTITFGGVPYYYINHVYYVWNPYYDGYVVADPPPVAGTDAAAPLPAPPASAEAGNASGVLGLQVKPLKGQNAQQTADDRYACDRWAVAQSGFNPINTRQDAQASPKMRSDYRRAFTACLQGRGYSVQ